VKAAVRKAVVLAAGLGTRMRREDPAAALDPGQAAAASAGLKGMIPIGRPFLDYVVSALAEAGIEEVGLVVGAAHEAIRRHYERIAPRRVRMTFTLQPRPLGTADAVLAAERFVAGEEFLALNSDNYYPIPLCQAVVGLGEPGLPVFERELLLARSNFPRERVARYAALAVGPDGYLERIVEKPGEAAASAAGGEVLLSMNFWRFSPAIFEACRRVPVSARGEFELPQAVDFAIRELGLRFRAVRSEEGVLDLSTRGDVAAVAQRLSRVEPRL
jgi:glucose-1-phosphate thymidylyltransferase